MKKIILAALLMMVGMTISAQPKEHVVNVFEPHWYIQAQGGVQHTLGEVDFSDLISPNVQLSVGYQFDKVVGARLSANAWQSKAGSWVFGKDYKWKWNYVAPGIDFTFNLSNLFAGYNPTRLVNVSAFIGAGANIAWKNDEAQDVNAALATAYPRSIGTNTYGTELEYLWDGTKTRFVGRAGINVDFRISDVVSLGIEANANCLNDKYNSKRAGNADWYFNALAGLKINLGKTHSTKTCEHKCQEPKVVEKIIEKIVEKP
ncbi:MAG: OmpA family protein, partial [Prevotellaceae bacterium]|nr:OmpA family protein [Prevotellaceae bacterium]